jgi:hypothetical protein
MSTESRDTFAHAQDCLPRDLANEPRLFSLGVTFRAVDVTRRLARSEVLLARSRKAAELAEHSLRDAEERLWHVTRVTSRTSTS